MAVFEAKNFAEVFDLPDGLSARTRTATANISLAFISEADNQLRMGRLPEGAMTAYLKLGLPQLDSDAAPTLEIQLVLTDGVTDIVMAQTDKGQTGGTVVAGTGLGSYSAMKPRDSRGWWYELRNPVAAATPVAGEILLHYQYLTDA